MKRKILFVDDEPNIHRALRRMLHPMRDLWEMSFADSGRQALEMLSTAHVDIIVCDLRMPDMDGIDLLTRIRSAYPHMVRIIFSADSGMETSLQAVRLAHQYIAKPMDAKQLAVAIERASMLRELLDDQTLRRRITALEMLPVLPARYTEIMASMEDPEGSVQTVGSIIGRDIGMSAKILQLANSAFFGPSRQISTPAEAAVFLGLNIIRGLVLTIGIFRQFDASLVSPSLLQGIYDHSIRTAMLARDIAVAAGLDSREADDAFTAGLLHDVGKLIIACNASGDDTGLIMASLEHGAADMSESETTLLGSDHGPIGGYLTGLWGLPNTIVETVAFHHTPTRCPALAFDVLNAVHVANALIHHAGRQTDPMLPLPGIDMAHLEKLGVAGRLTEWQTLVQNAP